MAHMYIHHISTTIHSSFYTSSILPVRLAAPDPLRPLQLKSLFMVQYIINTAYFSPLQVKVKES
jgi:hypothetical protein